VPTILVVDDEDAVRSTFRDVLSIEGHQVVTADSFHEARERLSERRFDVALTDLMLPEESGLTFLRYALEHDPELSVVLVTGHPDVSTAVAALRQGAYDYIMKPVTRQALVATVQRASERNALVRERQRLQAENEDYQRSLERKVRERTSRLRESERRYRDQFRETLRAYEELKRTQEKLIRSERLAAVGELAAQIAHEIRNPLGAISNSVGVLRRDLMLEGDDKRLLEVVRQESERLERIIADFLKFARPRPIHKTRQKITEIVDDLLLLLSQERGATGPGRVEIKKLYQRGLPDVELDAAQTREALWNLLVNAVEAMPQGGTLSVAVRRADDGDAIDVMVSDTGKGISEEEQKKIFQPFHTTKAEGTGLGLAIVQRVVEAHSGELKLESELGAGSAFSLRFPATRANDERQSIEVH
jgi:signal transduction histidine kinase